MNFIDVASNFIHESAFGQTYSSNGVVDYNKLKGFYAVDTQINSGYSSSSDDQVQRQIEGIKKNRSFLFSEIDKIKDHHMATAIKDSVIGDCFHAMTAKNLTSIAYRSKDKALNKLFTEEIQKLLSTTSFLEIFKDCLVNEGIDYGEMFLSTKCEIGEGIVEITDNVDIKRHLAIYKNLTPVGFIKFDKTNADTITPEDYINADQISHFLISPKKIPIKVSNSNNREIEIPEKVRCAMPLLAPVVDLICQFSQLEQLSTAIEINKALAPIAMGVGISPNSDISEIQRQLQQWSIALNSSRNAVINNLDYLNVKSILPRMNEIKLIPYSVEEGTNTMRQVEIRQPDSDLTEKLNNIRKSIALAIGIPESYLASSTLLVKKEENIASNPRYSRMLSGIQLYLARGIVELVYKHLKYRFTKFGKSGKPYLTRTILREHIEVKFNSITNIDNRLDMEQMLLTAETMGNIAGVIDVVAGSPNIPVKTKSENFLKLWENILEQYDHLRDIFVIDHQLEDAENGGVSVEGDIDVNDLDTNEDEDEDDKKHKKTDTTVSEKEVKPKPTPIESIKDTFS